jgi:hypothetical protein
LTRLGLPPFAINMDYRKPCRKSEDRADKKQIQEVMYGD